MISFTSTIYHIYGVVVHKLISKTVGFVLSKGLQKTILDNVFALGRAQVSEFVLNDINPLGYRRLSRLKSIFEGGKSLQLQFPAEDLGFSGDDGVESESKSALAPWVNYVDVVEIQSGEEASWWSICKMSERGAILVRPDQHIAWRVKSGLTLDPSLHMRDVFSILLGKQ